MLSGREKLTVKNVGSVYTPIPFFFAQAAILLAWMVLIECEKADPPMFSTCSFMLCSV